MIERLTNPNKHKGGYLVRKRFSKTAPIIFLTVALAVLLMVSMAYAAKSGSTTSLTIQTVSNKYEYSPSSAVTVRGVATANTTMGLLRLTSDKISSAKVTIKNPSGTTVLNAADMSKDSQTGLCFYTYTLPGTAPKGVWTATVTITDSKGVSGTSSTTFKVLHPVPDHSTLIGVYEGTKTCITSACHATQAEHVFNSVHYQWQGDTSKAIELAGTKTSKLGGINNFCIQPDNNWLTIFNKLDGTKGPGGCATCHAGLGLKPSATSSQAQLENIDCLICHSPTYKRIVAQNADGTFKMVPDPSIDIQAAAKNIVRPGKAECMRCHAGSGGGDNYKRGDLESTLSSCNKNYDVHMGTDGQNFKCVDCHRTLNHKIAGRGVDTRATETDYTMMCESCHTFIPHRSYNTNYVDLDRHTDRVYCTTCHSPTYARTKATDMHRDWSHMEVDTAKQLYDPHLTMQSNVLPTFAWYNTFSHFYKFKDPVALDSRGVQKINWPDGGFIDDPNKPMARIYPFKIHTALQPKNNAAGNAFDNILLPLRNKIAFETGDVDAAITGGASTYGITYNGHTFQKTEQYMGIFHGVGPKSTALSCSNQPCHGSQSRIPYQQMGYERRGTHEQLCDVCHQLKPATDFYSMHAKRHGITKNCSACHGAGHPLRNMTRSEMCSQCHRDRSTKMTDPNQIHTKHCQAQGIDCSWCHTYTGDPGKVGHGQIKDALPSWVTY